ncbi:hypothetical protein D9611_010741 [Ephemerocybe angulata]|uniref:Uncharacterized protein n=1 Tax=Ephemerocybe angulata TaxID=980116 RepID=A0A8H5BCR6_9AGAR|nr:hypothetical protein D9611_010741 [Tulosesus angulatus]
MRLIFGPVLLLALLISSLGLLANAYADHDEFIARSAVDALSTRGESLAVPFQHSLREFLEGAVDVYQRSLDEHEDSILEARTPPRTVRVFLFYKHISRGPFSVPSYTVLKVLAQHLQSEMPPEAVEFTLDADARGAALFMDQTIDQNGITDSILHLGARRKGPPPFPGAEKGKRRS